MSDYLLRRAQQLKEIRDSILNPKGDSNGYFKVFTAEAGLGKTRKCEMTLATLWKVNPTIKSIFVKSFIDRDMEYPSYQRINRLAGVEIAFSIDHRIMKEILGIRNKKERERRLNEIKSFPVLIITHSMYLGICRHDRGFLRKDLCFEGRRNLIIDEQLDILKTFDLDITTIKSVSEAIMFLEKNNHDNGFSDKLDKFKHFKILLNELTYLINTGPQNKMIPISGCRALYSETYTKKVKHEKLLIFKRLKSLIKDPANPFKTNQIPLLIKDIDTVYRIWKEIYYPKVMLSQYGNIKYFVMSDVVLSNKRLYSYDPNFRFLLLDNNIMLDASAKFNYLYKCQPDLFKIVDQERIKDFSNTTINICYMNTTKYAKSISPTAYDVLINDIQGKCNISDKILVVGQKEELELIKSQYKSILEYSNIEFVNFYSLRGKNTWKNFNKCFIIHTPNIGYCYHYFICSMINAIKSIEDTQWVFNNNLELKKNNSNNLSFSDDKLEQIRKSYIASHIYQAIMRVNREQGNEAEINIYNSDKEIIKLVCEQLSNVKLVEYEIKKTPRIKTYDNSKRLESSYIIKFIEFIIKCDFGEIKKQDILESIGWENKRTFNEKVVKRAIQVLSKQGYIIEYINKDILIYFKDRKVIMMNKKIAVNQLEDRNYV